MYLSSGIDDYKDFVNRMQRKDNVSWMDDSLQMNFIPVFSLSVLHLYKWFEIVNRSTNVFMLLTDVLISIFQSVEFVDRRVVSVILVFTWLYV